MNRFFTSMMFLLLLTGPSWAHEGEVHEEEKPVSPVTSQGGMTTQETSTESVELVLKHPPLEPKEKATLRLFLNTADENRPIANAKIELEISALKDFKISFAPIPNQPGIYSAEAVFPQAGSFDAVISISGGEVNDLLTLNGIQVGEGAGGSAHFWPGWKLGIGILALLFISVVIVTFLARKKRSGLKQFLLLGMILTGLTLPFASLTPLFAHGGEDHGDEGKQEGPSTTSTGNIVLLTKESQFLLKVLTSVAKKETVFESVHVLGKITHRATGQQDIFATGSGRFMASKVPIVGQQVRRGEVLGYLEIIGQITLRAPFDGIVSFVGFHPGEWVTAGSKLFTVADPRTVWVEAQLFEKDLPHITTGSKASVLVENLPEMTFPGKILAIGKTLDEQTRSALVTIEVPNSEGKLKIGQWAKVFIETATPLQAIVIPKSALLIKEGLPIVFVKEAAERFEARIVTVSGEFEDKVYITSGVSEGEKVVTQGNYQLLPFLKTLGK